jgi:hypothetical protein
MPMTLSGDGTITGLAAGGLPNATVVQADLATGVAGNGPAFFAFGTTTQTLTNGANTKIILNNELFDTANCFDSTTNYRFTPNVAGYYQINGSTSLVNGVATQLSITAIFKNGSIYTYGTSSPVYSTIQNFITVSNLVYLNGSTDYVELYVYHNLGSNWNTSPSQTTTVFSGSLVRAA